MLLVAIGGFVSTYNPRNNLGKFLNYANGGMILFWITMIIKEMVK